MNCREAEAIFKRVIEGGVDMGGESLLRSHMEVCPDCRARFSLDLALIATLKGAPEAAFDSVAGAVVGRARSRWWRLSLLRWGVVISAVSAAGLLIGWLAPYVFRYVAGLLAGGPGSRPETAALVKVASVFVTMGKTACRLVMEGLSGGFGGLGAYVAVYIATVGCVAILIMYGMGVWLRKPTEVKR
jgi:hypothetical protein